MREILGNPIRTRSRNFLLLRESDSSESSKPEDQDLFLPNVSHLWDPIKQHLDLLEKEVKSLTDKESVQPVPESKVHSLRRHLICQEVLVCRVGRTWIATTAKMEISVTQGPTKALEASKSLIKFMEICTKAKVKHGPAPRTEVERRISKYLESIEGKRPAQEEEE